MRKSIDYMTVRREELETPIADYKKEWQGLVQACREISRREWKYLEYEREPSTLGMLLAGLNSYDHKVPGCKSLEAESIDDLESQFLALNDAQKTLGIYKLYLAVGWNRLYDWEEGGGAIMPWEATDYLITHIIATYARNVIFWPPERQTTPERVDWVVSQAAKAVDAWLTAHEWDVEDIPTIPQGKRWGFLKELREIGGWAKDRLSPLQEDDLFDFLRERQDIDKL